MDGIINKRDLYFHVGEAYKKAHTNQSDQINHEDMERLEMADNLSDQE